jgi:hypothetical protein
MGLDGNRPKTNMSATLPAIQAFLEQCGSDFEVWPCKPELADTAVFCEHYGVALENSANAILVRSKTGEQKFVVCVLLATDRLNTNHTVRKKMGARKVSDRATGRFIDLDRRRGRAMRVRSARWRQSRLQDQAGPEGSDAAAKRRTGPGTGQARLIYSSEARQTRSYPFTAAPVFRRP